MGEVMHPCRTCLFHKGGYCRFFESLGKPPKPIPDHVFLVGCKKWQAIAPDPSLFELDDTMPSSVPIEDHERPKKRRKGSKTMTPQQPSVRYANYQWCPHLPKCENHGICAIRLKRVEREAAGLDA